jgi:hypothetical protein
MKCATCGQSIDHLVRLGPLEDFGCIGEGCPSADHLNGDYDYTPHRAGYWHWHRSGSDAQ